MSDQGQPTFALILKGSGTTHPFVTASHTLTGNRLCVVAINAYIATGGVNPSTPSLSGHSRTWTQFKQQDIDAAGTTDRSTLFWFRSVGPTDTTGTLTITFSGTIPTRASWGIDQGDANCALGNNGGDAIVPGTLNGTTSAGTVTTQPTSWAAGSMWAGNGALFACGKENNTAQNPKTNWTELTDEIGTTLVGLETQYLSGATTDTGGSSDWTTAARAGSIAAEIRQKSQVGAYVNAGFF